MTDANATVTMKLSLTLPAEVAELVRRQAEEEALDVTDTPVLPLIQKV